MCKAKDAAEFFIASAQDGNDDLMTNLRLQKLLYFAQGWSLARYGKPLFKERIEAWDWGPVVNDVYQAYKIKGRESIDYVSPQFSLARFSETEKRLLLDVFWGYRGYSTFALVQKSHAPKSPWEKAYRKDRNSEIPIEEIMRYFKSLKRQLPTLKINREKAIRPKINPATGEKTFPAGVFEEHDEAYDNL